MSVDSKERIYECWETIIERHLQNAHNCLVEMEKDFKMNKIPASEYQPYVKKKIHELIRKVDG